MRVSRYVMSTAAALAMVAMPAVSAHAQKVTPSFSYGVRAGLSIPFGDLSDAVNSGYTIGVLGQLTAPAWPVGVRGAIDYTSWGTKVGSESLNDLSFNVDAVLPLSPMGPAPYLVGGIGMHHLGSSYSGAGSENDLGFEIGGGYKWALAGFGAQVEARYVYVNTSGSSETYLPITFGINF